VEEPRKRREARRTDGYVVDVMHPPRAPVVRSLDFPAREDGGKCPAGGVHAILPRAGRDVLVRSEGVDSLDEEEGAMAGGEGEEEEGEGAE